MLDFFLNYPATTLVVLAILAYLFC